jgi:arsenate reductase (thioredoxin)
MAEVLLRRHAGERFDAVSAGSQPTEVHPLTRQVLQEIGEEVGELRAKPLGEFLGKAQVHYAFIVCEEGEDSCPRVYPFALRCERWPFPDPLSVHGTPEMQLLAFREVRDAIDRKLRAWVHTVE